MTVLVHAGLNETCLVCAGFEGRGEAAEDLLCARYIRHLLLGKNPDFTPIPEQLQSAPSALGHYALVELQNLGKLRYLISQNVDNLHLKSDIKEECLSLEIGSRRRICFARNAIHGSGFKCF